MTVDLGTVLTLSLVSHSIFSTLYEKKKKKKNIKKTRLFKYIENFTSKNWKFSDKKNSDIFHISAQNIDCGYSLEPPRRGGSNEYPQSMFLSRNEKSILYLCKPQFLLYKSGVSDRHVFVMRLFINPFMPSGLFYLNTLYQSISNERGVLLVFIIITFWNACI